MCNSKYFLNVPNYVSVNTYLKYFKVFGWEYMVIFKVVDNVAPFTQPPKVFYSFLVN